MKYKIVPTFGVYFRGLMSSQYISTEAFHTRVDLVLSMGFIGRDAIVFSISLIPGRIATCKIDQRTMNRLFSVMSIVTSSFSFVTKIEGDATHVAIRQSAHVYCSEGT